jgi:hypothetical protein
VVDDNGFVNRLRKNIAGSNPALSSTSCKRSQPVRHLIVHQTHASSTLVVCANICFCSSMDEHFATNEDACRFESCQKLQFIAVAERLRRSLQNCLWEFNSHPRFGGFSGAAPTSVLKTGDTCKGMEIDTTSPPPIQGKLTW